MIKQKDGNNGISIIDNDFNTKLVVKCASYLGPSSILDKQISYICSVSLTQERNKAFHSYTPSQSKQFYPSKNCEWRCYFEWSGRSNFEPQDGQASYCSSSINFGKEGLERTCTNNSSTIAPEPSSCYGSSQV